LAVDFVNLRVAIPMHFNTWPMIRQNPAELKPASAKVEALLPGQVLVWPG